MKRKQRRDARETRQRLLAAASEVFAEKGFWETTHVEICAKARINTAAVNYHFGGKENLYVEAWKHSFEQSVKAHPPDGGVGPEAPAVERLRGRILAFMHRMADPNNHEVEIMHKEMANPTGLLAEVLLQAIEPMRQALRSIVRELLGDAASEQQVSFCEMSLMSQCFGPMLHLRHARLDRLWSLASRSWPITSRDSLWRASLEFASKPGRSLRHSVSAGMPQNRSNS
jgi:AcrR family transcriptional regulator